jgi:FkbM family methyltransferase
MILKNLALRIPPIRRLYESRNSYSELADRLQAANDDLVAAHQGLVVLLGGKQAEIEKLDASLREKEDEIIRLSERVRHLEEGEHTFSSYGEDLILRRIFFSPDRGRVIKNGFYVDIGAHHPILASNTYFFYLNGWSGINVEANPAAIDAFERVRPNDINLTFAIGTEVGQVEFYLFGEEGTEYFGSSSTTSPAFRDYIESTQNVTARTLRVPSRTLCSVLDEFYHKDGIEFLSLDIEGSELTALESNDWEKYRPLVLAIEVYPRLGESETELRSGDVIRYVESVGYRWFTTTLYTWFFYDSTSERKDFVEFWLGGHSQDG